MTVDRPSLAPRATVRRRPAPLLRSLLLGVASLASACAVVASPDTGSTDAAPKATWHQDVRPVIEGRCVTCHKPGGIGPFDLSTYAATKAVGALVKAVTGNRTMPPWHAGPEQSFRGDPSLTDAQIQAISDWVDAGMPEGDPNAPGDALPDVTEKISRVDRTVGLPEKYTPPKGQADDYRCFLVDWPEDEEKYVTGFNVVPDNKGIVHHVAAFLLAPDALGATGAVTALTDLDKAEAGPGYACYGGPSGAADLIVPILQLGQWVPGQQGVDFPTGTGIRVPKGSKLVLQMHYNMDFAETGPDQTQVQFKLDTPDKIEKKAAFAPWLNAAWIGDAMKIPAGEASVTHAHTKDPRGFWKNFVGSVDVQKGFLVHGALLHMHTLGVWAETYITRKDGTKVMIVRTPSYDFDWQRLYMLKEPVTFGEGDTLTVRCNWNNTEAKQKVIAGKPPTQPKDVYWGEGSLDEMCVANLYITEL